MVAAAVLFLLLSRPGDGVSIATYRTSLAPRTPNQAWNIRVAARKVDGITLRPGDTFSFAKAVGPVSGEAGFVRGLSIRAGEPASEEGGGICQLVSTIYNAALRANLQIVERRKHLWPVQSVPPGLDATFSTGNVDLRFRNTLKQPVRLRVSAEGSHLTVRIVGERREEASVEVVRTVRSTLPPERIVQGSPLLKRGDQRVSQRGRPGFEVEVRRIVRRGGERREERISYDRYAPVNEILLFGMRR